jgi:hypothetical protein
MNDLDTMLHNNPLKPTRMSPGKLDSRLAAQPPAFERLKFNGKKNDKKSN